jgi:hypothetical protein
VAQRVRMHAEWHRNVTGQRNLIRFVAEMRTAI